MLVTVLQGIEPVTRTYNTCMIACNSSNHWQEALQVYAQMLQVGGCRQTTFYTLVL